MAIISIGGGKSLPGHPDSNLMIRVKFDEEAPDPVVKALMNVLGSAGFSSDNDGRRLTFRSNGANLDNKMKLAWQALHRLGYQRCDDAFSPKWPDLSDEEWKERMDMLFGVDADRFGFVVRAPR